MHTYIHTHTQTHARKQTGILFVSWGIMHLSVSYFITYSHSYSTLYVFRDSPDKTCRQTPQHPAHPPEAVCLYRQTSVSGGPLLSLNYEGREHRNSDRVQEPIHETGRGLGRRWKGRQRHEAYGGGGNGSRCMEL